MPRGWPGTPGPRAFPPVPGMPERHPLPVVMVRVTPIFDCPAVSPTAMQDPGTGQDTPNNSACTAPAGAGTGCSRQRAPSQVSANAPGGAKSLAASTPTAVQADGTVQDTVLSWLRPWATGLGLAWTRHGMPSQAAVNAAEPALVKYSPVAKQLPAAGHDTPDSWLPCAVAGGRGNGCSRHCPPLHRSASASSRWLKYSPTAVQVLGAEHETPFKV